MVAGSTPALGASHLQYQFMSDRVAQSEERLSTKQKAEGSSPSVVIEILGRGATGSTSDFGSESCRFDSCRPNDGQEAVSKSG